MAAVRTLYTTPPLKTFRSASECLKAGGVGLQSPPGECPKAEWVSAIGDGAAYGSRCERLGHSEALPSVLRGGVPYNVLRASIQSASFFFWLVGG